MNLNIGDRDDAQRKKKRRSQRPEEEEVFLVFLRRQRGGMREVKYPLIFLKIRVILGFPLK